MARAINVKPQVIQFLCTSSTLTSRFTFEIATVLGLNTRWLATGDGTMFLTDDPKHKFFNEYKVVPVLSNDQIIQLLNEEDYNLNEDQEWIPAKCDDNHHIAYKITDTSMEPTIPSGSILLIETSKKYSLNANSKGQICLFYANNFNALLLREVLIMDKEIYLSPKNTEFYKSTKYTLDLIVVGIVKACQWVMRRTYNAKCN